MQILFTTQICHGPCSGYLRETEQKTSWRKCLTSFFLWIITGLLVQCFPSFSRYLQGTLFHIKCWKWQKILFWPNPSIIPGRFPLVYLFSLLTLLLLHTVLMPSCKQNVPPRFQVAHWPKQHPLQHFLLRFTRWLRFLVCGCGLWQSLMHP